MMPGYLDYLSDKFHTENITAINQRLIELSSLFEISQILNSSLDLPRVLNNILLIPMGRLMISRGIIFLLSENKFQPKLWKGLSSEIQEFSLEKKDLPRALTQLELHELEPLKYPNLSQLFAEYQLYLLIPITSQEQLIGMVCYGKKLNGQNFSQEEKDFLNSLANLSATAIENALKVDEIQSINKLLDERIHQLKTLFDIAQGLSATLESEKIVKLLTYALMGQMLVYHYAIVLYHAHGLQKIDTKGFSQETVESLLTHDTQLRNITSAIPVESMKKTALSQKLLKMGARVLIPMRHQNKPLGFILLGEKINKLPYTEVDLEFLTTVVNQAIISLENARLFRETLEKQRMEQELQVAKTIQQKLLPREIITINGYDSWGLNNSSKEVGGDYFDLIPVSDNRYALAIGDVSGKSIPAALLMANLQAGLRTVITENPDLARVVGKLNNLIYQNTDIDKYITFFIGVIDCTTHHFTYVNAGHNPPFMVNSAGHFQELDQGGIILGMIPDYKYITGTTQFQPGDILICYTDGVSEALNREDEEYGEDRLKKLVKNKRNLDSRKLAENIVKSIYQFSAGVPQYDDITLLITRRLPTK